MMQARSGQICSSRACSNFGSVVSAELCPASADLPCIKCDLSCSVRRCTAAFSSCHADMLPALATVWFCVSFKEREGERSSQAHSVPKLTLRCSPALPHPAVVPPGYMISNNAMAQCDSGFYRSDWVMYSDPRARSCTPCGDGIQSEPQDSDETPLAAPGTLVRGSSASCCECRCFGGQHDLTALCVGCTTGHLRLQTGHAAAPCCAPLPVRNSALLPVRKSLRSYR